MRMFIVRVGNMNKTIKITTFIALLLMMSISFSGLVQAQNVRADLISNLETVAPGSQLILGLRLEHAEHWHTYWQYPGDAGLPTKISWTLPEGFEAGPLEYPVPIAFEVSGILGYGYEDETVLITRIKVPADLQPGSDLNISGKASWLECAEVCIPGNSDVSIKLKAGAAEQSSDDAAVINKYLAQLPKPISEAEDVSLNLVRNTIPQQAKDPLSFNLVLSGANIDFAKKDDFRLLPDPGKSLRMGKHPKAEFGSGQVTFNFDASLKKNANAGETEVKGLIQYPVKGGDQPVTYYFSAAVTGPKESTIVASAAGMTVTDSGAAAGEAKTSPAGFLAMFLFAIIGGLILNVMPCVLPVISLKVFSFVKQAHESRGRIFFLGLMYCLGVLASFWILAGTMVALKSAGNSAAWGALFQFPEFVLGVTAVVFVLGLNMLGVFEINAPSGTAVQGLAKLQNKEGPAGAFFTGVLATILATPCSAPFLGTAVAFALTLKAGAIFGIFTGIGIGLALPFLLLSAFPGWTRFIPKPGNWMVIFKQVMGFLLMATAVWLLSILGAQIGTNGLAMALAFLLALGVGCWMIGSLIDYSTKRNKKFSVWLTAIILAVLAFVWFINPVLNPPSAEEHKGLSWVDYSPEELEKYRDEDRLVFLDFTAEWCLTCKWNEKTVLHSDEVMAKLKETEAVTMKADFTSQDEEIKSVLESFGRSGVPLYVIYPPDRAEPIVLPEIINKKMVLEKLTETAKK